MKSIRIVALCVVCLLVVCGSQSQAAQEKVHVDVESICASDDLLITRLTVTCDARRVMSLERPGQSGGQGIEQDPDTGRFSCQVLLVSTVFDWCEKGCLRTVDRVLKTGGTSTGTTTETVEKGAKLSDLVTFTIKSGDYPIGSEIEVGKYLGERIVLKFE